MKSKATMDACPHKNNGEEIVIECTACPLYSDRGGMTEGCYRYIMATLSDFHGEEIYFHGKRTMKLSTTMTQWILSIVDISRILRFSGNPRNGRGCGDCTYNPENLFPILRHHLLNDIDEFLPALETYLDGMGHFKKRNDMCENCLLTTREILSDVVGRYRGVMRLLEG